MITCRSDVKKNCAGTCTFCKMRAPASPPLMLPCVGRPQLLSHVPLRGPCTHSWQARVVISNPCSMGLERQPRQQHVSSLGLLAVHQLLLFVCVRGLLCFQSCPTATSRSLCDTQPQHLHTLPTCSCLVLVHGCPPHPSRAQCLLADAASVHHARSPVCCWQLQLPELSAAAAARVVLQGESASVLRRLPWIRTSGP